MSHKQMMIYCLQQVSDTRYIALNRYYKPIGLPSWADIANYVDHPSCFEFKVAPTDATWATISIDHELNRGCVYLYGDDAPPDRDDVTWDVYAAKLRVLYAHMG